MAALTSVAAMTSVAARVHQDHAAEQPGVEHGRGGHDAGDDKPRCDDPDRQCGQEPAGTSGDRRRIGGAGCRSVGAMGGRIVRMRSHDRLTSNGIEELGMERALRAAVNRITARIAIATPMSWAVLSPRRTAGSSRR